MKNLISLISIIMLFNISCIKINDSTTSSSIVSIDDNVYYYKLCGSESICKFKCEEGIDISDLSDQFVVEYCKDLVAALPSSTSGFDSYAEKYILPAIRDANTFHTIKKISVDYDEFIKFDYMFSKYGNRKKVKPQFWDKCLSSCKGSPYGASANIWIKTTEGSNRSDVIYQYKNSSLLSSIQWSILMGSPTKMNYEEAQAACKNYNFKYNDWSLPNVDLMKEAMDRRLGDGINRFFMEVKDIELSPDDYAWVSKENNKDSIKAIQLILDGPRSDEYKGNDNSFYVICSREYDGD